MIHFNNLEGALSYQLYCPLCSSSMQLNSYYGRVISEGGFNQHSDIFGGSNDYKYHIAPRPNLTFIYERDNNYAKINCSTNQILELRYGAKLQSSGKTPISPTYPEMMCRCQKYFYCFHMNIGDRYTEVSDIWLYSETIYCDDFVLINNCSDNISVYAKRGDLKSTKLPLIKIDHLNPQNTRNRINNLISMS